MYITFMHSIYSNRHDHRRSGDAIRRIGLTRLASLLFNLGTRDRLDRNSFLVSCPIKFFPAAYLKSLMLALTILIRNRFVHLPILNEFPYLLLFRPAFTHTVSSFPKKG